MCNCWRLRFNPIFYAMEKNFYCRLSHFFLLKIAFFLLFSLAGLSNAFAQLSGTYTIGGADVRISGHAGFSTFSAALGALEKQGISGPVTFKVSAGTYEEQINISLPPGSGGHTLTIEGDASDRSRVILQAPGPESEYTLRIRQGTEGVRLKNLTIKGSRELVVVEGGTAGFIMENNLLIGEKGALVSARSQSRQRASHQHQYLNNIFVGGSTGLLKIRESDAYAAAVQEEGLLVIGNEFRGQSSAGISITNQTGYTIKDNTISAGSIGLFAEASPNGKEVIGNIIVVEEGEFALYFSGGVPEIIMNNQIFISIYEYGGVALYVEGSYESSDEKMLIANNLIKVSYKHLFNDFSWGGMLLNSVNADIYHNSIQLAPAYNTKGYVGGWSGGTFRVFNNNFANLSGANVVSANATEMDYNNLYSPGFDLAAWQAQTGFDDHSISVRPNGHTLHPALAAAGTYLEAVPADLHGIPRPNPPSIGAIELDKRSQYTIGGEDGDFASFTEALQFLEFNYGVDSILFKVSPGTYREQLTLTKNNFPHITFEGAGGDSTEVVLEYPEGYALRISSASNYTFRYMTIKGKGAVFIEAINDQPANDLSFENNLLESTGELAAVATHSTAKEGNSHASVNMLALNNNLIRGKGWGLYKEGSLIHFTSHNVRQLSDAGLALSGNQIIADIGGIFVSNTKGIKLENNQLLVGGAVASVSPKGIHLFSIVDLKKVNGNEVEVRGERASGLEIYGGATSYLGPAAPEQFTHNRILLPQGGTGVAFEFISSGNNDLIANNMVSVKGDKGSVGFLMREFEFKGDFVFNSIHVYGEDAQSKAFSFGAWDNQLHLTNNIFANSADGLAVHGLDIGSSEVPFFTSSDFNNLYASGDTLVDWNGSIATNLVEWQALSGLDRHSVSVVPQFVSNEELVPANSLLDGAGIAVEAVPTDFYGRPRSTPPDIGAVEFEPEGTPQPDPTAGFVTGGGWFYSPAGALASQPFMAGRAVFIFRARQQAGEAQPTGFAMLYIPEAHFRFSSYYAWEWLAVDEHSAILQGRGELNREEGYQFLLSVVDNGSGLRTPEDTYRILIRNSQGVVVYDNQAGLEKYGQATMAIGGGNILIREEKEAGRSGLALESPASMEDLKAYPTQLENEGLKLAVPAMEGVERLQLRVLDMQGRQVAETTLSIHGMAGNYHWPLTSQSWPKGIYLLVVEAEGKRFRQKLVK